MPKPSSPCHRCELTAPVVFVIAPVAGEVIATDTAQLPLAVSEPPVRLMVVAAAAAEKVPPKYSWRSG